MFRATLFLFGHVRNYFASLSLGDDDDEASLKMPSWLTAATKAGALGLAAHR